MFDGLRLDMFDGLRGLDRLFVLFGILFQQVLALLVLDITGLALNGY